MKQIPRQAILSLPPSLLAITTLASFSDGPKQRTDNRPNILLIMVDQMQTPPAGYGPMEGAVQDLKEVTGFLPLTPGNTYSEYFPGLMRLRQNSVVLKRHYTASAASVPSRSCIMTGQYPGLTGVTQTDGLFKTPSDVPFLDSVGAPTVGDMFRASGYSTHYFGKWHVSDPPAGRYLEPWGFGDWESSYPEPHGGSAENLGVYRDVVFGDRIVEFLNRMGSDTASDPWFTVASFVNPHDISAWPVQWQVYDTNGVVPWSMYPPPPTIPYQGQQSLYGTVPTVINGQSRNVTFRVSLNPGGFPNANSYLPPTYTEDLTGKPLCQQDYAYKWGLAWGSKTDYNIGTVSGPLRSPHPFLLQGSNAQDWALSYIRFYFYCQYLADIQINRVLQALDSNGLTNNTIVIFLSDHGDMVASHGGIIQKWHNAYEESVRVPLVISSPLINPDSQSMREILQTTSSIDLAPTLLGLAGIDPEEVKNYLDTANVSAPLQDFPGADLSSFIRGTNPGPIVGPDGNPRTGVLFISDDMITGLGTDPSAQGPYDLFTHRLDSVIGLGYPLVQGSVRQPNNVRAFCTGEWKIVQYTDPNAVEADQWELYCLTYDPKELTNLVDYTTGVVLPGMTLPGMTTEQIQAKNDTLRRQLSYALGTADPGPLPQQATLFQNSPNPFNHTTTLSFYLPETGMARLSVTDLSGREVEVVANTTLPRGMHYYKLETGSMPAGIYFYQLTFGNRRLAGKMILVK